MNPCSEECQGHFTQYSRDNRVLYGHKQTTILERDAYVKWRSSSGVSICRFFFVSFNVVSIRLFFDTFVRTKN